MSATIPAPPLFDASFDVEAIRAEFPALQQEVHPGKPLVYLDSAATALKPQAVIDAVTDIYARDCANVHRGVHALSQRATAKYEGARDLVQGYLGAAEREEIVFVRGATEGLNLVAWSWGRSQLQEGDEVLVTEMEHHSNIVPWQLACEATGAKLVVVPIDDQGDTSLDAFRERVTERTRVISFPHVANSLGTVLPVAELVALAREVGAITVVDGAQGIVHGDVDVAALDVDFYAFSGHKLYGPTGIGVLYGKRALLEAMPPWQGGGDMIDRVTFESSTWNDLPYKFEAGTPHIAGAVGLGAAIRWLDAIDRPGAFAHEAELLAYGDAQLREVPGLRRIGVADARSSVLSFLLEGIHPTDAGTILDAEGIAIRTGHHCAQPVMDHFGVTGTARASLALYNTRAEIDALVAGLHKVREIFGG